MTPTPEVKVRAQLASVAAEGHLWSSGEVLPLGSLSVALRFLTPGGKTVEVTIDRKEWEDLGRPNVGD